MQVILQFYCTFFSEYLYYYYFKKMIKIEIFAGSRKLRKIFCQKFFLVAGKFFWRKILRNFRLPSEISVKENYRNSVFRFIFTGSLNFLRKKIWWKIGLTRCWEGIGGMLEWFRRDVGRVLNGNRRGALLVNFAPTKNASAVNLVFYL